MKSRMLIVPILLLACGEPEAEICDTSAFVCDTAAYWERQQEKEGIVDSTDGVWLSEVRVPGCTGTDQWTYSATSNGWTNGTNLVNAWVAPGSGGFNEEHLLDVSGSDPDGTGDALEIALIPGAAEAEIIINESTSLTCGLHDTDPIMTYAIRIYDGDGNYADCAIFSTREDADAAINTLFIGTVVQPTPVTRPEELNAEACTIWRLP